MNHDYCHCLDFTEDCPKKCFRAELERDLQKYPELYAEKPLTYAHLKDVECHWLEIEE